MHPTPPKKHLLSLPNELLLHVGRLILRIARPHDLNSLTLTNRHLHALLTRFVLHWSAIQNRPETAARALAAGADPNRTSKRLGNIPPLFHAASKKHTRVAEVLLAAPGVDPNASTPERFTALMLATLGGHNDMVSAFFAAPGIDVNRRTEHARGSGRVGVVGETALAIAVGRRHVGTVRLLLAADAVEVDIRNSFGETPLRIAAEDGYDEVVSMLLEAGADPTSRDAACITPLTAAAANGHVGIVRLILATGRIGLEDKLVALAAAE
ncbi:ankyrin repeat-containing domain protein [Aspergillus carlsbadensis]|nr:ankyrin repeat-containing domain protein [Aspergillus carlsbadensis]